MKYYYIKFEDETLAEALEAGSFESLEEAIEEGIALKTFPSETFVVLDGHGSVIWTEDSLQ